MKYYDVVVIPKSIHLKRIIENIQFFDFILTDEEMKYMTLLDIGYSRTRFQYFNPYFIKNIGG